MCSHVRCESALLRVAAETDVALKRFGVQVDAVVGLQVGLLGETFITNIACKWTDICGREKHDC